MSIIIRRVLMYHHNEKSLSLWFSNKVVINKKVHERFVFGWWKNGKIYIMNKTSQSKLKKRHHHQKKKIYKK